jgi:uncharacterized protein YaaQ
MKMVMTVIQADDAGQINDALVRAGHRVTRMATTGGWLRRENATFLLGVEDEKLEEVLAILQQKGQRRKAYMTTPLDMLGTVDGETFEVEIGGATIFVIDIERFERY